MILNCSFSIVIPPVVIYIQVYSSVVWQLQDLLIKTGEKHD